MDSSHNFCTMLESTRVSLIFKQFDAYKSQNVLIPESKSELYCGGQLLDIGLSELMRRFKILTRVELARLARRPNFFFQFAMETQGTPKMNCLTGYCIHHSLKVNLCKGLILMTDLYSSLHYSRVELKSKSTGLAFSITDSIWHSEFCYAIRSKQQLE